MSVMQPVSLANLVERLRADDLLVDGGGASVILSGISDDSRHVRPGDLFCAWSGTTLDAHEFVPAAVAAGAAAVLAERPVRGVAVPQLRVRDGRRAAAVAASAFFDDPQLRLRLLGVTGTNGKTTSVWILRHMLSHREATASLGTLGAILEDGSTIPGSESLTTPGPVELARTLRVLVDRGVRCVAMEVSSHALDQGRVHTLRFAAAVFLNLTRDHLDYHGTLATYLAAKRSLVRYLDVDGSAVINADDASWGGLGAEAPHTVTFGTASAADVRASSVEFRADGVRFELHTPAGSAPAYLPLPGSFNVQNALAASAACLAVGFTLDEVVTALGAVPQVPGRLERIADRPCAVLRDYAHTPDALERVLEALRPLTAGRLILVFGAGGDRDRGKRPLMGAVAEQLADQVIVTSDNPRTEDPDAIIDEIASGMSGARHQRVTDRREAIARALDMAAADDIVLLAGKGHETYQVVGSERFDFDERVIVAQLLSSGEERA
jgi:UDP-N-acetylmuramoyl-L-alanyl-D-glutamate--2,6-diaminopimelate ligase